MPFNGSGVFQRVRSWVADAAAGIKIRADYHDTEDDGFAAGLSNCITKDGQTTITQNIPFNNRRIINLGAPVNDSDAATKKSAYDAQADKVFKAGDTMTGNLTIDKSSPAVILNKALLGIAALLGQQAGLARWSMYFGDDANEAGGNVGSNFRLICYDDAGAVIGDVIIGDRASGLLTVRGDPTASLGIATKHYVDVAPYQPFNAQLFAGIPPVTPAFPYTTILTDAQRMVIGTGAATLGLANSYPAGTCVSFLASGGNLTIAAGGSDTLYWQDGFSAKTGTRTMLAAGMATAYRSGSTSWVITGTGMS